MSASIKSISIIGSGNVAHHLGKALSGRVKINWVYSRNKETGSQMANALSARFADDIKNLSHTDVVLICVNDDEIENVLKLLPKDQPIAYTSGSVELNQLPDRQDLGVFYPLQTFSKDREIDLFEVPFFIEASNEVFAQQLFDLAWLVSRKVVFANSDDCKKLHVSAVMVNNFVNHISLLAKEFVDKQSLEWDHLKPLIKETALKLQDLNPDTAQTGPAMRNDKKTIDSHLKLLEGETKEIYQMLTDSIIKHYSK